jgi:hypothetical protein
MISIPRGNIPNHRIFPAFQELLHEVSWKIALPLERFACALSKETQ